MILHFTAKATETQRSQSQWVVVLMPDSLASDSLPVPPSPSPPLLCDFCHSTIPTPQALSTQPGQTCPYQVGSGALGDFKTLGSNLDEDERDPPSPLFVGDLQLVTGNMRW